ncbi:MAG TPA: hypothetical protein VLL97_07345, partial [Acidobacteriota bacterium]|nr:hypothetical protein [Acidobacteriota bacterium]
YEAPAISLFAEFSKNAIKVLDERKWRENPTKNTFALMDMIAQAYGLPGGGQIKRITGGWDRFAETRDLRYFLVSKAALESGNPKFQKKSAARANYENELKFLKEQHKEALKKGDKDQAQRIMQKRKEYQQKNFQRVFEAEKAFRAKKKETSTDTRGR